MFESRQRLDLFQKLIHCSLGISQWTYNVKGELLSSSPDAAEENNCFFALENSYEDALQAGAVQDYPLLITNSLNLMWIAAYEKEDGQLTYIHVIGPAFADTVPLKNLELQLSGLHLSLRMKNDFLKTLQMIPVVSLTNFLQYGIMLHYCATGEEIRSHHFNYQTKSGASGGSPEEKPEDKHGTWLYECSLTRLVEEGNLNYREAMNKMPLGGNPGRLSAGNPLRQLKNLLLSSVIIVSRAAIRGGLNPELSYTLSDKYIQNIENCSSMSELGNINEIMLDDYIHRVHEVKVNEYPTSFVRDCISYVSVHLTEDLDLPAIAGHFGYSPYYLSRKFKEEYGSDLRIFIRNARLDYAKMLLANSSYNVQEISEQLHFCSQSYFTQHFRERNGMTPSEFKAAL